MTLFVRELTARGRGAIRVLELAGPRALERVRALAPRARLASGDFARVELVDRAGELLDEAIALVGSPARVELHLHGSPVLVERLLRELAAEPWPPEGSLESRAEERLAAAASEAAARLFLDQAGGALRAELAALLERTGADFRSAARELARAGRVAMALAMPPRVVLAGPVNAGKSTLFNVLVGRERALVHPAAGTTRDPVRERVQLGAYAVELWDTAGERELGPHEDAEVERAGQGLSGELARAADLVLRLLPPGHPPSRARRPRERELRSCADLELPVGRVRRASMPALSALRDPAGARAVAEALFLEALALPAEPWRPGRGVPFEPGWVEGLAALEEHELRPLVRSWLDAR